MPSPRSHACRVLRNLNKKKATDDKETPPDKAEHSKSDKEKSNDDAPDSPTAEGDAKKEAASRLRVLAYSDSDSDVESHMQQVKEILPHANDAEAAAKAAQEEQEAAAREAEEAEEAAQLLAQSRRVPISRAVGAVGSALGAVMCQLTPGVALRAAALAALQRVNPPAGQVAQVAAGVVGAAGLLAERRALRLGTSNARQAALQSQGIALGKAVVAVAAARVLLRIHRQVKEGRLGRLVSGVNSAFTFLTVPPRWQSSLLKKQFTRNSLLSSLPAVSVLEEAERIEPDKPPETAAEFAAVFRPEILEMRRMLAECGVDLPPRFQDTDADLFRFGQACGLMEAETPAERGVAIEKAVRRVINTCEWMSQQEVLSETKLRRWERLVAWRGKDASGCPILLVRLARAVQLCTRPGRLERFAGAVAAQVAAGVETKLSDAHGGPERVVAVVDFRETSNWEAFLRSRDVVALAKALATDLAAHYPGRLEKVHLLELPLLAKVGLQSVVAPLAASTRAKIVQASATDETLPVTMALLQKRRSHASGLGRAMSDLSLATSDASTPRMRGQDEEEAEEGDDGQPAPEGAVQAAVAAGNEAAVAMQTLEAAANAAMDAAQRAADAMASLPANARSSLDGLGVPATVLSDGPSPGTMTDAVSRPQQPAAAGAMREESPATADVAANLLEALEEAGREVTSAAPAAGGTSPTQPVLNANDARGSHPLPMTPSLISPQTTEGSDDLHLMVAGMMNDAQAEGQGRGGRGADAAASPGGALSGSSVGSGGGGSGGVGRVASPWAGLTSLMTSMFPPGSTTRPRRPGSGLGSPQVRAHRLSTLSHESSLNSQPGTPVSRIKGGLKDLPPRPTSSRKTPAKSSLRRSVSYEAPTPGPLGSYPLRRQSSVSWAENLERIREIESTPLLMPLPGTPLPTPSPSITEEGSEGEGEEAEVVAPAGFPTMVVLLMMAGLLQRLLLGV